MSGLWRPSTESQFDAKLAGNFSDTKNGFGTQFGLTVTQIRYN
jgi:hypothetical protein